MSELSTLRVLRMLLQIVYLEPLSSRRIVRKIVLFTWLKSILGEMKLSEFERMAEMNLRLF